MMISLVPNLKSLIVRAVPPAVFAASVPFTPPTLIFVAARAVASGSSSVSIINS